MKKLFGVLIAIITILLLDSCSSDISNNITMTMSQGTCMASATNPTTAPYCMAVTLQNNSSGANANNIQIVSSGMTLNYTANGNTYSSQLCDPNYAGSGVCSVNGGSSGYQTVGNYVLHDPNNCVTAQGANVITLMQGGGTCTFYLQLSGESYPVGVYGTTLTYNYTNGNSNYSLSSTFNQRVNLYAGGSFTNPSGIAYYDNSISEFQQISPAYSGSTINTMVSDWFGNIYVGTNVGTVYQFNGSSWTQLPSSGVISSGVNTINSLYVDESSNVYAATNSSVYKLSFESDTWSLLGSSLPTTNWIGLQADDADNLYVVSSTGVIYSCNMNNCTNWSQDFTTGQTLPSDVSIFANAFRMSLSTPFLGANYGMYEYVDNTSGWTGFTGYTESVGAMIESNNTWYVGAFGNSASESAVYATTNGGTSFTALASSTTGNYLYGQVSSMVLDTESNLYVAGGTQSSSDFLGVSDVYASYLALSPSATESAIWTPITGITASGTTLPINSLIISTILTSY